MALLWGEKVQMYNGAVKNRKTEALMTHNIKKEENNGSWGLTCGPWGFPAAAHTPYGKTGAERTNEEQEVPSKHQIGED